MKKNKFIKSSIILIIGCLCTKILGMITKIVLTRYIGTQTLGLYSLVIPTYLLFISISGFGLSTSLNVLIASNKYNNKNLILYSLFISLFLDIVIMIILLFSSNIIATKLLNNEILYVPLLSIGLVLPFISVSNIFRSYYFSKERMIPHVISNILEDLIKLILIILFIDKFRNNISNTLTFLLIINIFSELSSIIIFIYKFPKFNITKKDIKFNKNNIKSILSISIPTTLSRLIGSITYFLEPIILTTILVKVGYTNQYIIYQYGIINAYVLPILLLPSFLTSAISQALIPNISLYYTNKNYNMVKKRINQALIISLILGIIFTSIFVIFRNNILYIMFNTYEGSNYILFLAPLFIFHYIEHPLLASLQAMNKANINMKISLINMFIRTIILGILCSLRIDMYALLISIILNILFTCIYSYTKIKKILFYN